MGAISHLPGWVSGALAARLEGVSRKDLAVRAEAISQAYRGRSNSAGIRSAEDALAYALVRMPATYAAVRHVLAQAAERCPGFAPADVLDAGAGPGTAAWAARETWPEMARATLVDRNAPLLGLAREIADEAAWGAEFVEGAIPAALTAERGAELVLASYALTEIAAGELAGVLARLWALAAKMLVIVEPGTPDGFARLLRVRDWLIAAGAQIAAPCTHAEACPLAGAERWCHFNQRLPRTRDHQLVKSAEVNFEDERFCYLVACKEPLEPGNARRILATPRVTKLEVRLTLCAPGAVEERAIARRQKQAYKAARHFDWGDAVEL